MSEYFVKDKFGFKQKKILSNLGESILFIDNFKNTKQFTNKELFLLGAQDNLHFIIQNKKYINTFIKIYSILKLFYKATNFILI